MWRRILPCFLQQYPLFTRPFTGRPFFVTWIVLGPSVGKISGESEGVVKVLTEFSEATEIVAGSIFGAYRDLLCGEGLS